MKVVGYPRWLELLSSLSERSPGFFSLFSCTFLIPLLVIGGSKGGGRVLDPSLPLPNFSPGSGFPALSSDMTARDQFWNITVRLFMILVSRLVMSVLALVMDCGSKFFPSPLIGGLSAGGHSSFGGREQLGSLTGPFWGSALLPSWLSPSEEEEEESMILLLFRAASLLTLFGFG